MWESLLATLAVSTAASVVHYAMRLLSHRTFVRSLNKGLRIKGLESEPSDAEHQLAIQLLWEIEKKEKKPLRSLGDKQVEEYIRALSGLLDKRLEEVPSDKRKAEAILKTLGAPPPLSSSH